MKTLDRPVLLDTYCCAGGATRGYQRAGFYVVGVDIDPQPHYCGDRFIQADALAVLTDLDRWNLAPVAVHASPPCQRWSAMSACRPNLAEEYPAFIEPTRERLQALGLPYVIENVPFSPLLDPTMLCGRMFGRDLYRHRLFETNFDLPQPSHPEHLVPASKAGHWTPGTVMSVAGHFTPVAHGRLIMDIDWMNREEMAEAIPPYYAEYVGSALMAHLTSEGKGARAA